MPRLLVDGKNAVEVGIADDDELLTDDGCDNPPNVEASVKVELLAAASFY